MGRESVLTGNRFEEWLNITHNWYLSQGKAWVEKNPVPAKFIANGGVGYRLIPTGKALPDYGGWLAGGQGVLFEAKSTQNKELWSPPKDRAHQYEYLMQAFYLGAQAFYLVEWSEWEEVRLYAIEVVPTPYGTPLKRSLGEVVNVHDGYVDWLSAFGAFKTHQSAMALPRIHDLLATFMSPAQADCHLREIGIILKETMGVELYE